MQGMPNILSLFHNEINKFNNTGAAIAWRYITPRPDIKWASSRENLSSGCPTKRVSNQSPKLQRLARKLKFHL